MENIKISIVVPVFDQWGIAFGLWERLSKQTLPRELWEVIAVDNGSKFIDAPVSPPFNMSIIKCDKPGSYAARNYGIAHAKGDLLIFTDADCQPECDWLEEYWKAVNKFSVMTMVAGPVKVKKLTDGIPNKYEIYDTYLGIPQEYYVTKRGYAVTANLAVPKAVFDTVGLFDDSRFSGGDAEFCQRATKLGVLLRYLSGAVVLHPARSSWISLETKARRVKGGQLRSGPFFRRLKFLFKSFLIPVVRLIRVIRSKMSVKEKVSILPVVFRLGVVEIKEILRLLLGHSAERR